MHFTSPTFVLHFSPTSLFYLIVLIGYLWAGIAQSVKRLATGWTVRGSKPGGSENSHTRPDRPWGPPQPPIEWVREHTGELSWRGVALTAHPHLAPRLKRKSRAIHLLPLRAFVVCSRERNRLFDEKYKYSSPHFASFLCPLLLSLGSQYAPYYVSPEISVCYSPGMRQWHWLLLCL